MRMNGGTPALLALSTRKSGREQVLKLAWTWIGAMIPSANPRNDPRYIGETGPRCNYNASIECRCRV